MRVVNKIGKYFGTLVGLRKRNNIRELAVTPQYLIRKFFDLGDIANNQIACFAKAHFTSGYLQLQQPIRCRGGFHSLVIYGFYVDQKGGVMSVVMRDEEDEALCASLFEITVDESLCLLRELCLGQYDFVSDNL